MVQEGALTALASVADSSQVCQDMMLHLLFSFHATLDLTLFGFAGTLPKIL